MQVPNADGSIESFHAQQLASSNTHAAKQLAEVFFN
jgi:hypothetical protein